MNFKLKKKISFSTSSIKTNEKVMHNIYQKFDIRSSSSFFFKKTTHIRFEKAKILNLICRLS